MIQQIRMAILCSMAFFLVNVSAWASQKAPSMPQSRQLTVDAQKTERLRNKLFLHSVQFGKVAAVEPWLRHGMDPNLFAKAVGAEVLELTVAQHTYTTREMPALMLAIIRSRTQKKTGIPIVKKLLAFGANPNTQANIIMAYPGIRLRMGPDDHFSAIRLAADVGHPSIIRSLLAAGAEINGLREKLVYDFGDPIERDPVFEKAWAAAQEYHAYKSAVLARNYWNTISTLIHAGMTSDYENGIENLVEALILYTAAKKGGIKGGIGGPNYFGKNLPSWRILMTPPAPIILPAHHEHKAIKIRNELDPFLPTVLTNIVAEYAGRMHPDVEEFIQEKMAQEHLAVRW